MVGVGFARSVLLARLLDVDTFGVYAGATAIVALLAIPAGLGLGGAFLHRAPETEDEDRAAANFLSIQTVAALLWGVLMTTGTLAFSSGHTRTALLVISWTTVLDFLCAPSIFVLQRRVIMKRIATIVLVQTIVVSVVAVILALQGFELWALLSSDIVGAVIGLFAYALWRPDWRLHLRFDRAIFVYYMRFGIPTMLSQLVETGLQRLDDLYVRFSLGIQEMGYYSRAYTFATYPRAILAVPVSLVAGGAFAEIAHDRLRFSKAFFRTNAMVVRGSFLMGLLLVTTAPEFVTILLGEKWLPMVPIFQLFSFFTLFDPLRDLLAAAYIALGLPRHLLAYRLIQLAILAVCLLVLGTLYGANGVALSVNIMLATGLALMYASMRGHVDFSLGRLFRAPVIALLAAVGAFLLGNYLAIWPAGLFWRLIIKALITGGVYAVLLLLQERSELIQMLRILRSQLSASSTAPSPVAAAQLETIAERVPNDPGEAGGR